MENIEIALGKYLRSRDVSDFPLELTLAPENTGADFSTNLAMRLTIVLHQAPLEIASEIKDFLESPEYKIEIAPPGFLNFTMSECQCGNPDITIDYLFYRYSIFNKSLL